MFRSKIQHLDAWTRQPAPDEYITHFSVVLNKVGFYAGGLIQTSITHKQKTVAAATFTNYEGKNKGVKWSPMSTERAVPEYKRQITKLLRSEHLGLRRGQPFEKLEIYPTISCDLIWWFWILTKERAPFILKKDVFLEISIILACQRLRWSK